jgi:hypothetical protein
VIAARLDMSDGSETELYWDTEFKTRAGGVDPSGLVPPGLLLPQKGGPVQAGTIINLQYTPSAPVDAELTIYVSTSSRVSHSEGALIVLAVR